MDAVRIPKVPWRRRMGSTRPGSAPAGGERSAVGSPVGVSETAPPGDG